MWGNSPQLKKDKSRFSYLSQPTIKGAVYRIRSWHVITVAKTVVILALPLNMCLLKHIPEGHGMFKKKIKRKLLFSDEKNREPKPTHCLQ